MSSWELSNSFWGILVIQKFNVPPFDGCQTPSEGFRLQVIHKLVNGLPYEDIGIPLKEFFVMYNLLMESPILHWSGESRCTPIPGKSLGIRPGLPSKWSQFIAMQSSFFFLEVFCFVHQTNTFKINNAVHFSHSQNCKVNYLKLQIWRSKLLQSIMFTWALQLIYAHGGQCPSYVLSEVRLCASDPVQDCIKGEPLCNPCCGPRWLRLAFIIVC